MRRLLTMSCSVDLLVPASPPWLRLSGSDWNFDILEKRALKRQVQNVVIAQSQLHKQVLAKVEHNRARQRTTASRGSLPDFSAGDIVLEARVRRSGSSPKLVTTWTGPWRIVTAEQQHVSGV